MKVSRAMKTPYRLLLVSLALPASSVPGCGGAHDRQMIYTAPRVAPVQVNTADGVRVRAPFVDVRVPASKQVPPSNGVDVPIIEPE
jgi:hypothetical protein